MFDRIASNPGILGGRPCIRGTRISVEFVLELLASGGSVEQIVRDYPQLKVEDVNKAVLYAAHFLKNESMIEVEVTP